MPRCRDDGDGDARGGSRGARGHVSEPAASAPVAAGGAAGEGGRHDAFISYARRPTDQRFVDELCRELEARGKRVWVDRSDIPPAADWLARIAKGIEGASSLIFVLSPRSAASEVCQQELSIAIEQNKRVIPVLHEAVAPAQLPPALARLNWISFTEGADRDAAFGQLLEAIDTDLDWRDEHTRLTVRVNEWVESGRDGSFLLRGRDLRAAEAWYAAREGHRETPTAGQVDYIIASRNAVSRRQRLTLAAVSVALAVAVVLAIFALVQRSDARQQASVALSGELAAEASGSAASDVRLESLLGLESFSRSPTVAGRSAVVGAVEQPLIATMAGSGRGVESLAATPDRTIVAAGTAAGVELWNVRTRTPLGAPFDSSWQVNGVAFSPDGQLLAVAEAPRQGSQSISGGAAVYSLSDRRVLYRLSLPQSGGATAVAFSPSGDQVAVTTGAGAVLLWTPSTGASVAGAAPPGSSALSVAFNHAGAELAAAFVTPTVNGENGAAWVYSVGPTLVVTRKYAIGTGDFDALAFAPDGVTLAAGSDTGSVEVFDTAVDATTATATISVGKPVSVVAFPTSAKLLATGDDSGTVRLWDLGTSTDQQVGEAMEDGSAVHALAFVEGGRSLVSAGADGALFIWDATGVSPSARVIAVGEEIRQLALAADGDELVTIGYRSGVATAWDTATGRRLGRRGPTPLASIATSPDSTEPATAAAVDRRGDEVALGLANGDILLESRTLRATLDLLPESGATAGTPSYELQVVSLAFSRNGRFLAAGLESGQTALWTLHPLRRVASFQFGSPEAIDPGVTQLAFNPATSALVVATADAGTLVVNLARPRAKPRYLETAEAIFALAFTPDGDRLLAGDVNGNVEVFDTASPPSTGSIYPAAGTLYGSGNALDAVAVSPDGQTLATGDSTGIARLWDLSSDLQLGVAVTTGSPVFDAAFSASGQLVTASMSGEVIVWPALLLSHSPSAFSRALCPRLSRNLTSAQWQEFASGQPYHATCPGLGAG